MSEAAIAPAEGGAGSGAPAATEGAAAAIIESGAVDAATQADAPQTPAPAPEADRSEHNRRLIEIERERRRIAKEREAFENEKREVLSAREQAKKDAERAESFDKTIAEAKRNPGKFLEATGLTIDDLVRWKLNDGEVSPELLLKDQSERTAAETKAIREELAALKKEREDERAELQKQAAARQREEAVAYFQGEIEKTLQAEPDKYEFTIAAKGQGEVFDLIDQAYREKGVCLAPAQAAEMVEKYYRQQYELFEATKTHKSKYQPLSTAAPTTQPGKPATQAKPLDAKRIASPAAMTNSMVTSPVTPGDLPPPLESREEFLERAKRKLADAEKEKSTARK